MAKPGPTPDPNAPTAVARRRVPGVTLRSVLAEFPEPRAHWLPETCEAYSVYISSRVAFAVEDEDVPQVTLLFDYRDRIQRLLDFEPEDNDHAYKIAQQIKIYDGMAARLSNELGIGPLARTRLGLAKADEQEKVSKLEGFV